ncbi:MAG: DEAD/DEAH box helicase, partial [Proteobacteria bacterium]|nr:DEAD/DEAH box helicase [Pseudomonadota bacterium]
MPGTQKSLFEQLKRKRTLVGSPRKIHDLFFQMRFADDHACLVVVDAKGKEIEAHYRDFGGHIREILKIVELIREKSKFSIDWEGTENGIDLSENGFLLWHLGRADSFVDENFSPIRFVEEPAELVVSMEGDAQLECRLVLECLEDRIRDFRLIDETHVFWNGKIYTIPPLGDDFSLVPSFETMIFPSETDKYLSLLFSHCENIGIRYRDYEVVEGPVQPTRPSLVFEKVDGDNSLYLRVSSSLPGFDPDFFDNYELSRVAAVNELENAIVVSQVDPGDIFSTCRSVEKTLNRYKKELEDPDADFYRDDNLFIIEGALAEKMIRKDLPRLVDRYMVFGAEKLKSYRVKVVEPELNLNLNHGLDFLEGDIGLTIEGEVFSLFEALHQYRRNSYIALNDGTHALLDPDYVQKLERIFQKKRNKVAVSFFDLPLVEELIGRKTAEETFAKSREIFEGFNRLDTMEMPVPEIRAEFRPYQVEGYKWMRYLHEHSLGGCLADDMGLGKTLQAIALLSSIYPGEEIPSLVVIPKSLIFNWENEIKKFNPDLSCHIYYGNDRDLDRARKHHLIITTYGMVRSDIETLKEVPFYYLILDESQNIKNINSQVSRAVMLLQSENRLALSG